MEKDINVDIMVTGVAITAILIILLWRLSSGAYGKLSPSNELTISYKSYHVDPDSNYYISGSDDFPAAVIGIEKSLTLDADLWKRINPKPDSIIITTPSH